MKISDNYRKILAKELKFAAKKMKAAETAPKSLYYYTATYGMVLRILNLEYNPTLVFLHLVLLTTYTTINQMAVNISTGQEMAIEIPKSFFDKLAMAITELSNKVEKDENIYTVLEKISNIAYAITGNGYYLYQKGILKI